MGTKTEPAVAPRYAGRVIAKRTLNFGIGGSLELPDELLEAVPRSLVTVKMQAELSAVKHLFTKHGEVDENTILTVDASTVEVLDVAPPAPQPEQAELGEGDPEGE